MQGSVEVIKVGSELVIKFGYVFEEEASNQREAFRLLDPTIIRVPRVYHFFTHDDTGYLVMEYIDSQEAETVWDDDTAGTLSRALKHLHSFEGCYPGPAGGGVSAGILWEDPEEPSFDTKADLQSYLNSRLVNSKHQFNLLEDDTPLVFCHLDVAPRNIKLLPNGVVCLLDWASAGYYPRYFELAALRHNDGHERSEAKYCQLLERAMVELNPFGRSEMKQMQLLDQVVFNCVRYCFASRSADVLGY